MSCGQPSSAFMKETFIVAPGAHGLTREVENLGSEAECDILPARWILPGGAIAVASELSFRAFHIQDSRFEGDE